MFLVVSVVPTFTRRNRARSWYSFYCAGCAVRFCAVLFSPNTPNMTMRSVQDRFWADGWVRKLNPLDRYLFLYLLTNEHTNWAGIYELDLGMMAFESGLDERDLERSFLPRLCPKIIYVGGWVYIPNWIKHHMSESGTLSPQQKEGVRKAMDKVPDKIRLTIKEIEEKGIPYTYPPDTVSPSSLSFALSSSLSSASAVVQEVLEDELKPKKGTRGNLIGFPAFWEVYPRKEDKMSASAIWRNLSTKDRLSAMDDIKNRKTSDAWTKEKGKYIPLAKNYLEGKRWEDEGVVITKKTDDKYAKYD